MLQVVYISFASESFNSNAQDGLDDILLKANEYNKKRGITGMLLYRSGVFLQLIEGDLIEIQKLFGKISMDLRHEGLKILVKQQSDERLFEDWSMACRKIDELDLEVIDKILPFQKIIEDTKERKSISKDQILEVFKAFRYKL